MATTILLFSDWAMGSFPETTDMPPEMRQMLKGWWLLKMFEVLTVTQTKPFCSERVIH